MSDSPRGPLDFEPEPEPDRPESAEERERRWAHRRDPDLDEVLDRPPVKRGTPSGRYTWFVGVAFLVVIAIVFVNSLTSDDIGSQGIQPGKRMPVFAAPLVLSSLDGAVNLATKRNDREERGKVPACELRRPDVLNACELWRKPVVLAFFATRGAQCVRELDLLERLRPRYPDVSFAAIAIKGDRDELRELVRKHRWGFPVGYDVDGRLTNVYGVAVCPQVTYAHRGGIVNETTLGEADLQELEAQIRRLRR
jgi:hypothetical protein